MEEREEGTKEERENKEEDKTKDKRHGDKMKGAKRKEKKKLLPSNSKQHIIKPTTTAKRIPLHGMLILTN